MTVACNVFNDFGRGRHVIGANVSKLLPVQFAASYIDEGVTVAFETGEFGPVIGPAEQNRSIGDLQGVGAIPVYPTRPVFARCTGEEHQIVPEGLCHLFDADEERVIEIVVVDRKCGIEGKDAEQVVTSTGELPGGEIWYVVEIAHYLPDAILGLGADSDFAIGSIVDHQRHDGRRNPGSAGDIDLGWSAFANHRTIPFEDRTFRPVRSIAN